MSLLLWLQVLTYKKAGEECVKASGIPYTVVRPGRLTEGPFTGKGAVLNMLCDFHVFSVPVRVSNFSY